MKITVIILSIFLAISFATTIVAFGAYDAQKSQLASEKTINASLNDQVTKLLNDNTELYAKANLKSFENVKALERFLKGSETIKNSDPYGYASESCISLMKEAKEGGYWMGITAINTSDESIYSAMTRKLKGATDIQWHVFNIAIVGDSELYLIDSQEAESYYKIASMSGDFAEYNKTKDSNVDNLNIH
jgi:hypothetical protein